MDTFVAQLPLLLGMPEASGTSGSAGAGGGQLVSLLVTFGLIIVIFYFFIIRPQSKKQKDTQKMLSALKKGDKVVTVGGIRGTIHSVKEDSVLLRVDENTKLEVSRSGIAHVIAQAEGDGAAVPAKEKQGRKGKSNDKPGDKAVPEAEGSEEPAGNGADEGKAE